MGRKTRYPLFVSVVIPVFNREKMVQDAVESVLSQRFNDFELIVVDDGSTDDTPQILDRYADRITVIRQENKGVSSARNAGIKAAQGTLVALLDSDDKWLPGKLSAQVDFFSRHKEAMICQTEEIWIRNGKRVNPKKYHKKYSGMIFEKCLPLCIVSPSAVMMKKELFDEMGLFDEMLPACEDYDMWLKISRKYPIHLINQPLIIKRGGHADQLSKRPGLDKYRILALKRIIQSKTLSDPQHIAAVAMLKEKCAIYAGGCLKRGKVNEAAIYTALSDQYWKRHNCSGLNSEDQRSVQWF